MSAALDDVMRALGALPPEERAIVERDALEATKTMRWVPNPGPQTAAYYSLADELFYGGSAGSGKSDLGIGLNEHCRSLILREFKDDARDLGDRLVAMAGSAVGWNGQQCVYRAKNKHIEFDGLPQEKDKQRWKGRPHDLYFFDELVDFFESQYEFLIGWCRTVLPNQRCRVVGAGNPPTQQKGLWVIQRWAPWLDPTHPKYPYPDGELVWYLRDSDGDYVEVDGPGPYEVDGKMIRAKSRTFIRAKLSDNPDLANSGYADTLANMPKELRDAYMHGKFDASIQDNPFQVIPTAWVLAAQQRWKDNPRPPPGVPMCAIGVDPAQGGSDRTVLAPRYDYFYPKFKIVPGAETPLGSDVAGLVVAMRRDEADVVLDMGGGYGSGCYQALTENGIEVKAHKGAEKATGRTSDGKFGFVNKRSQVCWKFREALDPDQPGGSPIALPESPYLLADLTVMTFIPTAHGIKVMSKEDVVEALGRSPDEGDAVIMAWSSGLRGIAPTSGSYGREQIARLRRGSLPKVDLGPRHRNR